MYDDLYGVQGIEEEVLVCPFSIFIFIFLFFLFFLFFWWPQWLFLFNSHLSSLGSFDFCPLWDLFLTLGAILYILQEYRRSFTLYKGTQHKENVTIMMQIYASARVAGYAMILARHVIMIRARPN